MKKESPPTIMIRNQTTFNFAERILSRNLRIETGQELLPCGKMLAIAIAKTFFNHFVETISGDELEKLLEDAIVKHCRISCAQIKDYEHL